MSDDDAWVESVHPDDAMLLEQMRSPIVDHVDQPPLRHPDETCAGWTTETFVLASGWRVQLFYDGGDLDYVDRIIAPDGRAWSWGTEHTKPDPGTLPFGDAVFNFYEFIGLSRFEKRRGR